MALAKYNECAITSLLLDFFRPILALWKVYNPYFAKVVRALAKKCLTICVLFKLESPCSKVAN